MNELIVIKQENALQVFTTEKGLDPYLTHVIDAVKDFVGDAETETGRKEIKKTAQLVVKSRTTLEKLATDLYQESSRQSKAISAEKVRMIKVLKDLQEGIEKPLTEWEEAEKARQAEIQTKIDEIRSAYDSLINQPSGIIRDAIQVIKNDGFDYQELTPDAEATRFQALKKLDDLLQAAIEKENNQAELEQLRAKQAEQDQKDRDAKIADQARLDAEAKAKEASEAVQKEFERKELELKLAAEKAEREKLEAQQREEQAKKQSEIDKQKAVENEQLRVKQEQEKTDAEKKAREANREHRAKINNEILSAFRKQALTEEISKGIITAIAEGQIPHVTINY